MKTTEGVSKGLPWSNLHFWKRTLGGQAQPRIREEAAKGCNRSQWNHPGKARSLSKGGPGEMGVAFRECHFPKPFTGAVTGRRGVEVGVQLPTPRLSGRETPTRRWSRTSCSSRAPWSPRSEHCPSLGSGWAAPRSRPAGLEGSPCLQNLYIQELFQPRRSPRKRSADARLRRRDARALRNGTSGPVSSTSSPPRPERLRVYFNC